MTTEATGPSTALSACVRAELGRSALFFVCCCSTTTNNEFRVIPATRDATRRPQCGSQTSKIPELASGNKILASTPQSNKSQALLAQLHQHTADRRTQLLSTPSTRCARGIQGCCIAETQKPSSPCACDDESPAPSFQRSARLHQRPSSSAQRSAPLHQRRS